MKKAAPVIRSFIFFLSITFLLSIGPLASRSHADDAWKDVRTCHNTLRANLKTCQKDKCAKKAFKIFSKCAKKATKKAKLKKGSTYKKLSASIQSVVDAVQPLFKKCYSEASSFEKKAIADVRKKTKDKKELKKEIKKVLKETEKVRGECFSTAQKMSNKALEAQVGQHFEK
ncbi:MAG: hypothetical protein JEZ11_23980 [Desulfobacterales bacterium]|nr:hypothetical protein [Desulfobacterales bacterium]